MNSFGCTFVDVSSRSKVLRYPLARKSVVGAGSALVLRVGCEVADTVLDSDRYRKAFVEVRVA